MSARAESENDLFAPALLLALILSGSPFDNAFSFRHGSRV
jgi:hypothetical protein